MSEEKEDKLSLKGTVDKTNQNPNKKAIPRPNNIITDIYGVISSWDFSKDLKNYVKNNILDFLTRNWKQKTVVLIVNKLREQTLIDKSSGFQIPLIEEQSDKSNDSVIKSVADNILWQMESRHSTCKQQLDILYNQIWSEAYKTSRLKTHTFSDVKNALKHWRSHQFIKIYSYASGPQEGQKLFLSSSINGDLTPFIANHINSSGGYKYDANKFRVVISALRESDPQNILYFTDDPKKARSAIEARLRAIVVLRPGNTKYSETELKDLITITSFEEIIFEEQPGKPAPCC